MTGFDLEPPSSVILKKKIGQLTDNQLQEPSTSCD